MNIGLLSRFRPLIKELRGIHTELKRMNDMRERELGYHGLNVGSPPPVGGDEPAVTYTDEAEDFFRELAEEKGKIAKWGGDDE